MPTEPSEEIDGLAQRTLRRKPARNMLVDRDTYNQLLTEAQTLARAFQVGDQ